MSEKIYTIDEIRELIVPVAKKHGIKRVFLFGSYARGDADSSSDIDLRIDTPNISTLFELGEVYADFEEAIGKSLDLVTTETLRNNIDDPLTRSFIKSIRKDEILLYEETE
jgi:predicted nucleotidyltransferase